MLLPAVHPFLDEDIDTLKELWNARDQQFPITTFDQGFIQGREENFHDDKAIKAYSKPVYFMSPGVSPERLRDIIPARFPPASNIFQNQAKWVKEWQAANQTEIGNFLFSGVEKTVTKMGGKHRWARSASIWRAEIAQQLFDINPMLMCYAMWAPLLGYVSFEAIWANNRGRRRRWQKYCRRIFLHLFEMTYKARFVLPTQRPRKPKSRKVSRAPNSGRQALRDVMFHEVRASKHVYHELKTFPIKLHVKYALDLADLPVVATGSSEAHIVREFVPEVAPSIQAASSEDSFSDEE
ncbi:hypothetical protein MMC11_008454 [Xylographa trunciseda]|nr:hypothetical protein [Xylographa trunciseda]